METIKRLNKKYKDLENLTTEESLTKTLLKKAKGFVIEEVVEEFLREEEGNLVLTKKKVTTKEVPPDAGAIKVLIELQLSRHLMNKQKDEG